MVIYMIILSTEYKGTKCTRRVQFGLFSFYYILCKIDNDMTTWIIMIVNELIIWDRKIMMWQHE